MRHLSFAILLSLARLPLKTSGKLNFIWCLGIRGMEKAHVFKNPIV